MNEPNQLHPGVAVIRTELVPRLRALDRRRIDPGGRIHDAELAVLAATKALHAAKARTADLLEQKRAHERGAAAGRANAETFDRETVQFEQLLVSAGEDEHACDVRRRQALLDAARLKLDRQAARCQECIATIAEAFQAFVDEAERFAQVYQATQPPEGVDPRAEVPDHR